MAVRQMRNYYKFVPKMKHGKDDIIYTQAEIDLIADDDDAMRDYVANGPMNIRFRNHERDKWGHLTSVEAYYGKKTDSVRGGE